MSKSKIEWTEKSWNPTTGCTKISSGCDNCYAEVLSERLMTMGVKKYGRGFRLAWHVNEIQKPVKWKKPSLIFVNSMSDLFHEDIPDWFISNVFETMNECSWHIFQILTKRESRLLELNQKIKWTPNIWMGVTVESEDYLSRVELLKNTNAKVKFISCEPLLTPIPLLSLDGIDWVIVGGESGPRARIMKKEWVLDILHQCKEAQVKFFFKQWGGRNKKKNGRELDGRIYNEYPFSAYKQLNLY
jgi:protein gp37